MGFFSSFDNSGTIHMFRDRTESGLQFIGSVCKSNKSISYITSTENSTLTLMFMSSSFIEVNVNLH